MGVLGLWKLLDATGKPVPLETLEGKVLAVDVSIWIHQVIQGYQDRRGSMLPNAHLIGLFNRICKLLYFKIKPVFVFDGGVPLLKKNTIANRRKLKSIAASKAQKLKNDLINNLIKHTAIQGAIEKDDDNNDASSSQSVFKNSSLASSSQQPDLYKLPDIPIPIQPKDSDDYIDSDDEPSPRKQTKWAGNIHSVDITTEEFRNLPADVRYDILTDLKETRKQSSWGRMHELPAGSDNYSGFQVGRLLKRRTVQESLEIAEKEMGGKSLTLEELDRLLTDQGISTTQQDTAFRIASDSTTRVVYIKDTNQLVQTNDKSNSSNASDISECKKNATIENNEPSTTNEVHSNELDEEWISEGECVEITHDESQLFPRSIIPKSVMNPALAYMLENSNLSKDQILKIVEQSKRNKKPSDENSSNSSMKKRKKNVKKNLFTQKNTKSKRVPDPSLSESSNLKKEISDHSESATVIDSNSESDEFVEIPMEPEVSKKEVVIHSSESDSDDFIEIHNVPIPELFSDKNTQKDSFQIVIKAEDNLEDDIFADVFSDIKSSNDSAFKSESKTVLNLIQESTDLISPKKEFPLTTINEESEEDETFIEVKENEDTLHEEKKDIVVAESSYNIEKVTPTVKNIDSIESKNVIADSKMSASTEKKESLVTEQFVNVDMKEDMQTEEIISKNITSEQYRNVDMEEVTQTEEIISKNITSEIEKENVSSVNEKIVESDTGNLIIDSEDFLNDFSDEMLLSDLYKERRVEKPTLVLPTDEAELEIMKEQLESERQKLQNNLGKLERQAVDITEQMRSEAQELLRLFGLPYIVAPMEAEAQCAYLEQIKLVDGTITDDSDVWLFGSHCVYKNFFDNNKRVLQFLSDDIEHHFKLTRKEMILLALLVGSDYTNGLAGVGPVTGLEILASFPTEGEDILRGLRSFCAWFRAGRLSAPTKSTLRNKLKNIQIEKGFPSQAVVQAYLCPTIDDSRDEFSWGKPNLVLLADYVKQKFGWTKLKFEEIMNPVLKKMAEGKSQKGISSYFKVKTVPKSIEAALSKRVQNAVHKLHGKREESDEEASVSSVKEKPKRAKKTSSKSQEKTVESTEEISTTGVEKPKRVRKTTAKKRKSTKDELDQAEEVVLDPEAKEKYHEVEDGKVASQSENETTVTVRVKKAKLDEEDPEKKLQEHMEKIRRRRPLKGEVDDYIPQRERDKANALKVKLKAIEIFRKSKISPSKATLRKRAVRKVKKDAELSESSSDE
ncbi:hypothetical protein TKK_0003517 [Trichogramma kaykai]